MNDFTNYHSKAMKWCMYTNEKILSTVGQDDSVLCDPDCARSERLSQSPSLLISSSNSKACRSLLPQQT